MGDGHSSDWRFSWPPVEGAQAYRLFIRDVDAGAIVHKSVAISGTSYDADPSAFEPGHEHVWRLQWCRASDPPNTWHDAAPYLLVPRAVDPALATPLSWEGDQGEVHRVVVRDEDTGAIVSKYAVRGTKYVVDWSRLDVRHVHRWNVQRWDGAAWQGVGRLSALNPPEAALVAVRRERSAEPLDLGDPEQLLLLFTIDTETGLQMLRHPDPVRAVELGVFGRFEPGGEDHGIGLHMDLLERYGFRGCFFLDVLMELQFGSEAVARTAAAIRSRGHEVQLHLHTSHLTMASDLKLRALTWSLYRDDADAFRRALEHAVTRFTELVGQAPVGYRSGGYNLSPAFLDVLPEFGITVDSSLNAFKNCRVPDWMRTRTQPFVYGDVLEAPVSWMIREGAGERVARGFNPARGDRQDAFTRIPSRGRRLPLLEVYVSHSYSLLEESRVDDPAERDRWNARLAETVPDRLASYRSSASSFIYVEPELDRERLVLMERTLSQFAARGDVRSVTCAELHEQGLEPWRSAEAEPADPVPVWLGGARRAAVEHTQTFSASFREHLEAELPAAAQEWSDSDAVAELLADVERDGGPVFAWTADREVAERAGARWSAAGDLRETATAPVEPLELIVATGLDAVAPTVLLESLRWCHERLLPGGRLILATRTIFASDAHAAGGSDVPGAHLLFGTPALGAAMGNGFCAATYLTAFRRAGFEFESVDRVERPENDPFLQRWAAKLRHYEPLEARTTALTAVLRRPLATPLADFRLTEQAGAR